MSIADDQPAPELGARVTKRRRGIYLLPNLFTTAGLFAGFYAIVAGMQGRFEPAAIAIFVAMVMDGIDGRIARLTRTESDFGKEYDSLADMVSFGLAPALVVYTWSLSALGKFGWLVAFVYAACAALRLARFNARHGAVDKRYFQGLASPAAAAVIAGMVWVGHDFTLETMFTKIPALIVTLMVSALMVSNIRYYSFRGLDLKGRVRFVTVLAMMLVFVLIAIAPPQVLFAVFFLYAVSGPGTVALRFYNKQKAKKKEQKRLRDSLK